MSLRAKASVPPEGISSSEEAENRDAMREERRKEKILEKRISRKNGQHRGKRGLCPNPPGETAVLLVCQKVTSLEGFVVKGKRNKQTLNLRKHYSHLREPQLGKRSSMKDVTVTDSSCVAKRGAIKE